MYGAIPPVVPAVMEPLHDPEQVALAGVRVSAGLLTVTENVCAAELPHKLFAVTVIVPLEPAVAVMLVVVLVPLQPPGKVQVYDVAPLTAAILYVFDDPAHNIVEPLMLPG